MTVATGYQPTSYKPGAAMAARAIGWPFLSAADVVVAHRDAATGSTAVLVPGTHYEIVGDGPAGTATVRALQAWPVDDTFTVTRSTPRKQNARILAGVPIPAAEVERQLDRETLAGQELAWAAAELDGRTARAPAGEVLDPLPTAAARANRLLGFDALGRIVTYFADVTVYLATAINFVQLATGALVRSVASKLAERVSILDFIPTNLHAQIAAGTCAVDLRPYIQAAIDHGRSKYLGGSFLGGGIDLFFPAGRYRTTGLIWKNGVSMSGEGFLATQLLVSGNGTTMIAASANTATQTTIANLYYGHFRDMGFYSWEAVNGGVPVNQISWDAVGFSRWKCERIYFGWGAGHLAIRCTGAILAGSGGPTSFYNSFVDCNLEKAFAGAGGVGALLGDTDAAKEQVTTWYWTGGSIRGAADATGTGVNLQSGTGCAFTNVVFEALTSAIIFGSAAGTRQANQNVMRDCYWEGCGSNATVHAGCNGNRISGGHVTGGGFTAPASTNTVFDLPGQFRRQILGATADDFWEVVMVAGGSNRPRFRGSTVPCVGLRNDAGVEVVLMNAASVGEASQLFKGYKDGSPNDLFAIGDTNTTFQAENVLLRNSGLGLRSGAGSPEGAVTAPVGALFLRINGAAATSLYVKETGTGNTGWVAK